MYFCVSEQFLLHTKYKYRNNQTTVNHNIATLLIGFLKWDDVEFSSPLFFVYFIALNFIVLFIILYNFIIVNCLFNVADTVTENRWLVMFLSKEVHLFVFMMKDE